MILEVEGVTCAYNGTDVLSDVTCRIGPEDVVGVIGPNGAGKSTLIRTMSRVLQPRLGRALLNGKDLYRTDARDAAKTIAVVPQEASTTFEFTCQEIVMMGRSPHLGRFQSESEEDRRTVEESMKRTDTWDLRQRSITTLSGGERQRVILARAIAQQPKVLLLDEPTAHLDLGHQVQIMKVVRGLGCAVVSVLHDLNLAAAYCRKLLLLDKGVIRAVGPVEEVLTREHLEGVYGIPVHIEKRNGSLTVLPKMP